MINSFVDSNGYNINISIPDNVMFTGKKAYTMSSTTWSIPDDKPTRIRKERMKKYKKLYVSQKN